MMRMDYMEPEMIVFKVFLALIMGGIIGAERELKNKPAGFVTLTLVCMGSTMIAILETILIAKGSAGDMTRLSAQVISGVGFIGGGTILRTKGSVQGLTSAAVLWVSACLGLIIGYGMLRFSFLAFFSIITILLFMRWIEEKFIHKRRKVKIEMNLIDREKIHELTEIYSHENNHIKLFQIKWIDFEKNKLECIFFISDKIPRSHLKKELEDKEYVTLIE